MVYMMIAVGVAFLIGMRFKVLAVVPVMVAAAVTVGAIELAGGASFLEVLPGLLLMMVAMQAAYLCGAVVRTAWAVSQPEAAEPAALAVEAKSGRSAGESGSKRRPVRRDTYGSLVTGK